MKISSTRNKLTKDTIRSIYHTVDPSILLKIFNRYFEKSVSEQFSRHLSSIVLTLQEYKITVDNIVENGPEVLVFYKIAGLQRSDFENIPPTNNKICLTCVDHLKIEDSKVIQFCHIAHQVNTLYSINTSKLPKPQL